MKRAPQLVGLIAALLSTSALSQDFSLTPSPAAPLATTSPAEAQARATPSSFVEIGILGLSRRNSDFARYNGLGDGRLFALINGRLDLRDPWNSEGARFLNLDVDGLGTSNRRLDLRYGVQGDYALDLGLHQFTRTGGQGFISPFQGLGSTKLSLPSDWVGANRSGDFKSLDRRFGVLGLGVTRERTQIGLTKNFGDGIDARASLTHDHRDGLRAQSLSFGSDANNAVAVYFPEPINQDIDTVDLSVQKSGQTARWKIAYRGVVFVDHQAGAEVQNPYTGVGLVNFLTPVAFPSGTGFISAPPSSSMHQLALDGSLNIFGAGRLSGHGAFGLEQQNDPFAPYTINPGLSVTTPVPRASLNGEVYRVNARISLATPLRRGLDLDARISLDQRDNRTPQALYLYIISDSQNQANPRIPFNSQNARLNAPYSWDNRLGHIALHQRLWDGAKFSLSGEWDDRTKDFQSVRRTTEKSIKASLRDQFDFGDGALSVSYGDRRAGAYVANEVFFSTRPKVVTDQFGPDVVVDHPLARKYDVANRARLKLEGHVNIDPVRFAGLGLDGALEHDDYAQSVYGLTSAEIARLDLDLHLQLAPSARLALTAGIERRFGDRSGYYLGGFTLDNLTQVWRARDRDLARHVGAQMDWAPSPVLSVKARADYLMTATKIAVASGNFSAATATAPLPDINGHTLQLGMDIDYAIRADLTIKAFYGFDRWIENDVTYSALTAYSNALGSGLLPPRFGVHRTGLSLRYGF
jgi:MtrB/PioB family decaheme-associated outer membrane protein